MKRYTPRMKLIEARGNIPQSEMAKKFNTAQQSYSRWELGKTNPPPRIMKKMEEYFKIPMEELFPDAFNSQN